MKKEIIIENIFVTLAKSLALFQLKKQLPKAMKQVEEDPETVSALESLQYYADRVNKLLPEFCKRNPQSNLCKKKGK